MSFMGAARDFGVPAGRVHLQTDGEQGGQKPENLGIWKPGALKSRQVFSFSGFRFGRLPRAVRQGSGQSGLARLASGVHTSGTLERRAGPPSWPHRAAHRGAQGSALIRNVPETLACASSFWSVVVVPPMIDPGESSAHRFKADNSMFSLEERIYSGAISVVLSGVGLFGMAGRR